MTYRVVPHAAAAARECHPVVRLAGRNRIAQESGHQPVRSSRIRNSVSSILDLLCEKEGRSRKGLDLCMARVGYRHSAWILLRPTT